MLRLYPQSKLVTLGLIVLWQAGAFPRPAIGQITGVSIAPNSQDNSRPTVDNVYSMTFTSNVAAELLIGVGIMVNPDVTNVFVGNYELNFAMHDHDYVALQVPNPDQSWFSFTFDSPRNVSSLDVFQWPDGPTRIAAYSGNDVNSLSLISEVFGPDGDVLGSTLGGWDRFQFGTTTSALFYKFVITKTGETGGYAMFRAIPVDPFGAQYVAVPIPEPAGLCFVALAVFFSRRTKRTRGEHGRSESILPL